MRIAACAATATRIGMRVAEQAAEPAVDVVALARPSRPAARAPPSPTAARRRRRATPLPRAARPAPTRRVPASGGGIVDSRSHSVAQLDVGGEPGPPAVDDAADRVEHHAAARARERRRGHDRAEHLRRRRAVPVELDDEVAVLAEHAVPRPVEPVHVVLEAVAQRDARDRQAVARLVEQPRQQLALLLGDERQVRRDDRREQRDPCAAARRRQVDVIERDATRRHVPAGVPDGQLGEQHGLSRRCAAGSPVPCILADEHASAQPERSVHA